MTTRHRYYIALLFLAAGSGLGAQERNSELTVFGAYRFGGEVNVMDSDAVYDVQDSPAYGLIWNRRHEANTQWEVFFAQQRTDVELDDPTLAPSRVAVELDTLQLGGTYRFEGDAAYPYIAMTLGGTHARSDARGGDSDTFFSGSLGLGMKFGSGERLGLRIEARVHAVLVRDDSEVFCQTGPGLNVCAIDVEGDVLAQLETFAGITFRF